MTEPVVDPVDNPVIDPDVPVVDDPVVPDNDGSLIGKEHIEPTLTNPSTHAEESKPGDDIPEGLVSEDGKLSIEGFKAYKEGLDEKDALYEKRILDARRMISTKDDFVDKKEDFFLDFAPPERFMKYYDKDTPEETTERIVEMEDMLAEKYLTLGLNRRQALEMSNTILEVMETNGVLDTRTEDQVYIDQQKHIKEEKLKLGSAADTIIRESKEWIHNLMLRPETKNNMLDMMENQGADFISLMYELKQKFAGEGGIPVSVNAMGSAPSDEELRKKVLSGEMTSEESSKLRHLHNRPGKLFD